MVVKFVFTGCTIIGFLLMDCMSLSSANSILPPALDISSLEVPSQGKCQADFKALKRGLDDGQSWAVSSKLVYKHICYFHCNTLIKLRGIRYNICEFWQFVLLVTFKFWTFNIHIQSLGGLVYEKKIKIFLTRIGNQCCKRKMNFFSNQILSFEHSSNVVYSDGWKDPSSLCVTEAFNLYLPKISISILTY